MVQGKEQKSFDHFSQVDAVCISLCVTKSPYWKEKSLEVYYDEKTEWEFTKRLQKIGKIFL